MMVLKRYKIQSYEIGLYFRNREFRGLLGEGRHWFLDPLLKVRVEVVSQRNPWLVHEKLDMIVKSGALQDRAVALDLKDHQRGLVWIEGRFSHILPPGLYAYWTGQKDVKVEVVDARKVRFEHAAFCSALTTRFPPTGLRGPNEIQGTKRCRFTVRYSWPWCLPWLMWPKPIETQSSTITWPIRW